VLKGGNKMTKNPNRIIFLDTLRAFIIFLVIVLHLAVSYIKPPMPGWVNSTEESLIFGILLAVIDALIMPIMFFIAGYFTLPSLLKGGSKHFVKGKFLHIGIPFVLGVILLAPLLEYTVYCSEGNSMNYFTYWLFEFFKPGNFTHYHLWFLGLLLIFFLITAIISAVFKEKVFSIEIKPGTPPKWFFILFVLIMTAISFAANVFFKTWDITYLIIVQFQNVKLPIYMIYFLFGMYAFRNSWFKKGYNPKVFPSAILFVISMLSYLTVFSMTGGEPVYTSQKLAFAFTYNIVVLSGLFTLLALFKKYANNDGTLVQTISKSSFSTYIIHLNVIFIILYVSRNISIPLPLKFITQLIIGTLVSWVIGYLLRKMPILKKVL
jgi:surface polysaccharide O-acyltransferase-like enzyme